MPAGQRVDAVAQQLQGTGYRARDDERHEQSDQHERDQRHHDCSPALLVFGGGGALRVVRNALCIGKKLIKLDDELVHRVSRALQKTTIGRRQIASLVNLERFLAPGTPGRHVRGDFVHAPGIGCDLAQPLELLPELAVEPVHLIQDGSTRSRVCLEQGIPVQSTHALDGLLGLEGEPGERERLLVAGACALVQSGPCERARPTRSSARAGADNRTQGTAGCESASVPGENRS